MINSVRQTVMSVLNKNNYGYISPSDFNLFAKQAQLDLFENYFYSYNYQILKENARQSGSGYADITKGLEEVIDLFSVTGPLMNVATSNSYTLPSLATTNNDWYLLNKILVYTSQLSSGTTTSISVAENTVEDAAATFVTDGVAVGDIASLVIGGVAYNTTITAVTETVLTTNLAVWTATGSYWIYESEKIKEAEKVTHSKITMLQNSVLTKPSLTYPAYTQEANLADLYPLTVLGQGQVVSQYIRYPFVPKWTYLTLTNGEPSFDGSAADYQDFELPNDDEVNLVNKILQYAGMSIREVGAVQFAQGLSQQSEQEEK